MGPVAIVLYGEGGRGRSNIEFRRDTLVRGVLTRPLALWWGARAAATPRKDDDIGVLWGPGD